jgi:hypothetical protein
MAEGAGLEPAQRLFATDSTLAGWSLTNSRSLPIWLATTNAPSSGGSGESRTHAPIAGPFAFEATPLDHSGTLPCIPSETTCLAERLRFELRCRQGRRQLIAFKAGALPAELLPLGSVLIVRS